MEDQIKKIKRDASLRVNPLPSLLKDSFKPYSFQHRAIIMMYVVERMVLAYDVGLGKSAISITNYCLLKEKGLVSGNMVVYAPGSALYQWKNEIENFTHLRVYVVDANFMSPVKRQKFYEGEWDKFDCIITTHSMIRSDLPLYYERLKDCAVYIDEVLALKNRSSLIHKTARKYLTPYAGRLYGISATIMKNNLVEPYNVYRIIKPSIMPTVKEFEKRFCDLKKIPTPTGLFLKKIVDHKNEVEFAKIIANYYIGLKKSQVEEHLPKVSILPIYLRMCKKQTALYLQAIDKTLKEYFEGKVEGYEPNPLEVLIKCQQIVDIPEILGYDVPSAKLKDFDRFLRDDVDLTQEKLVVFNRSRKGINYLCDKYSNWNPLKITGEITKASDRNHIRELFNTSPDHNLIFLNTAGKEALNLQSAGKMYFFNLDFAYGDINQLIGRINRLGSGFDFNYIYFALCKGTIDEYIYQLVVMKESWFRRFLGTIDYRLDEDKVLDVAKKFQAYNKELKEAYGKLL